MKHAINELKELKDTWGSQKDAEWIKDIDDAINVLSAEHHRADMAQTNEAERKEGVAAMGGMALDPEHAEYLSKPGGFVPPMDEPQKPYAVAAVDPSFKDGKTIYGYNINGEFRELSKRDFDKASGKTFNSWKELQAFLEDDLGELDPTKACDLSKEGGCETCQ